MAIESALRSGVVEGQTMPLEQAIAYVLEEDT